MASQSGDNILIQAPRRKHKNPPRHYPGVLSRPIRSTLLISLYTHLNTDTQLWPHCSHSNLGAGEEEEGVEGGPGSLHDGRAPLGFLFISIL